MIQFIINGINGINGINAKFYPLNNLLFKPTIHTIQGVGFFALGGFGIFTFALWAW